MATLDVSFCAFCKDKWRAVDCIEIGWMIFFVIARGESPWRYTVSREANRTVRTRPLHTVDCRVSHLRPSSQWQTVSLLIFSSPLSSRGLKARGDLLWTWTRRGNSSASLETRWIDAKENLFSPRGRFAFGRRLWFFRALRSVRFFGWEKGVEWCPPQQGNRVPYARYPREFHCCIVHRVIRRFPS